MTKHHATRRNKPEDKPVDLSLGLPSIAPRNARLLKFFEGYVKTGSVKESGLEAGFSESWVKNHSSKNLRKYAEYIVWLKAHVSQELAKQIAIDLDPVLQEIARIAFANEFDYLTLEPAAAGKPAFIRRKRLDELTREQMAAIVVLQGSSGLEYKLKDKEPMLLSLGKHLGAFNEKIILEHRHRHLHAHFDLSHVPDEKLNEEVERFERLVKQYGEAHVIEAQ